jgi:hypothetical protein
MLVALAPAVGAQSGAGTVNGRVVWGSCLRIPLPMGPSGTGSVAPGDVTTSGPADAMPATPPDVSTLQPGGPSGQPGSPDSPMPVPGIVRPGVIRSVPAGAVLVAIQNTAISARTDEAGRFSLSSVPAGQYFTVAAGPVANATSATAQRPNVFVSGGQSVEVGTLVLGSMLGGGGVCGPYGPGVDAAPGDVAPGDAATP